MAALLRHGAARRLGGSMLQRAQLAEDPRRRLGSSFMHTKEGAGEDATRHIQPKKEADESLAEWNAKLDRFDRFDAEFTKFLKAAVGLFSVYAILSSRSFLDEMKAARNYRK